VRRLTVTTCAATSALFCQQVLQHGLVEAQVGNQLFKAKAKVFFLELPHVLEF